MRRLLVIVMLLGGVIYASAEDLLYVCGQKLNLDRDYNGVTEGLSSGSYSYNHSTQELVFNSATITRTSGSGQLDAIYSNINALRIIFKGTNKITTTHEGICLLHNTSLINEGTVTIKSSNSAAIYVKGGTSGRSVRIIGGTWNLTGRTGLEGEKRNDEVVLYDSDQYPLLMTVKGTDGSIFNLHYLTMQDMAIGYPFGAYFNYGNGGVCYEGSSTIVKNTEVVIAKHAFDFGGKQWTTWNTVLGGSNMEGTIKYYADTNTLYLGNATVSAGYLIPYINNLTLISYGTNTLKNNEYCINSDKDITIQGSGILNTGSILLGYSNLTLEEGVTVNVSTTTSSYPSIVASLVAVNKATLNINVPSSENCLSDPVRLTGSVISSPQNAILCKGNYDNLFPGYDNWGNICGPDMTPIKGSLSIVPGTAYDLWVNGVRVNDKNCDDMSGLVSSGSCRYSPSSKTLTLNNATINSSSVPAIYNKTNGLTISTTGTSHVESGAENVICSLADFTISGSGHLKVASNTSGAAIEFTDYNLTINNTELTASGGTIALYAPAINALQGILSYVYVNNSKLHLKGSLQAVNVGYFDPNGNCDIVKPVGGKNNYFSIIDASGNNATEVEIVPKKKISTVIDDAVYEESIGETCIYTTSGTLVWKGTGKPQLPRGLYIIQKNGKSKTIQF